MGYGPDSADVQATGGISSLNVDFEPFVCDAAHVVKYLFTVIINYWLHKAYMFCLLR